MKHSISSAQWISLLLAFSLVVSLSACNNKITEASKINESNRPALGEIGDTEQFIITAGTEIDTLDMNNYMQGGGLICASGNVYFNDKNFYYTLNSKNGEVNKAARSTEKSGLECDGILVGDTVFSHRGKLYQFSNPDAEYQLIGETKTETGKSNTDLNDFVLPYEDKILYTSNSFENENMILLAPVKNIEKDYDWPFAEENDGKTYLGLSKSETVFESNNSITAMGLYEDILLVVDEYANIWTINLKNSYEATQIVDGTEIQTSWAPKKIVVSGDYIYFSNDIDYKIERLHFDGTGRETFLEGMNGSGHSLYTCDSENFYHIDYDEGSDKYNLYRTKIDDPSDSIILASGDNDGVIPYSEPGLYIAGDSVYYLAHGWWRAKIDGSGAELIRYNNVDENVAQTDEDTETHEPAHEITIGDTTFNSDDTSLWLSGNDISSNDFEPLREMTNLKKLTIMNTVVRDISVLSELTDLEELYLPFNEIVDISPLAELQNLKTLSLAHNRSLGGISPLLNLSELETLDLTYTHLGNGSLDILAQMTQLKTLDLSQNLLSDVSVLYGMKNLESLNLWENDLTDSEVSDIQAVLPNCRINS